MIILFVSIFVPLGIYLVFPSIMEYFTGKKTKYKSLLAWACFLYFISWYLPSPLIEGRDTSFTTHFIGGGIFSGLVWLYLKNNLSWKSIWLFEGVSLFALVSSLGVLNELAELALVKLNLVNLHLTDTSWDLVANTLGAFIFWLSYLVIFKLNKTS